MKAQVANYQYRALCLRIEPVTGAVVRITNYLYDLVMSNGDVYLSSSGYDFTGYQTGTTASPSMVDIQGILGLAGIGVDQIQSGVYDGARCYLFACEWNNPVVDYEPIVASILGKTHILDQKYMIEEMSLSDALGQSIGRTYQPLCQKQLGSRTWADVDFGVVTTGPSETPYTVPANTVVEEIVGMTPDGDSIKKTTTKTYASRSTPLRKCVNMWSTLVPFTAGWPEPFTASGDVVTISRDGSNPLTIGFGATDAAAEIDAVGVDGDWRSVDLASWLNGQTLTYSSGTAYGFYASGPVVRGTITPDGDQQIFTPSLSLTYSAATFYYLDFHETHTYRCVSTGLAPRSTFSGCNVDLLPHTFTGAITSVVDSKSFGSTDLTQAADYFKAGLITFTSGDNAGLKGMEIKAFALGGAIEVYEAFYYTPQVGDTFTIIAGCQKRIPDCRDKFANVLNYGGFPNIPVSTTYTQVGG